MKSRSDKRRPCAALLRRGRFALDPPGYEARIKAMPLPNPGRFRLKLVKKFD